MYCFRCGHQLDDSAKFCSSCGQALTNNRNPRQPDSFVYTNPASAKNGNFVKSRKIPGKKTLLWITIALIVLVIIVSIISSSSGGKAKYLIELDGGVSFKIYDDIENGPYNGKLIEMYDPDDLVYFCDNQGNDIGKLEWESESYDSHTEAEQDLSSYVLLAKGFGYEVETVKKNGISVKIFFDPDSNEYDCLFCVDNYIYELEFEDVDRSFVNKILGSLKK